MRISCGLLGGAGVLAVAFAIVVWGVTFASTRALLVDFSSFEILVLRFSLAWALSD